MNIKKQTAYTYNTFCTVVSEVASFPTTNKTLIFFFMFQMSNCFFLKDMNLEYLNFHLVNMMLETR